MKIYILADMEGISGIRMRPEVDKAHAEYEHGRQLMMAEMNVVIDAAFGAGAGIRGRFFASTVGAAP